MKGKGTENGKRKTEAVFPFSVFRLPWGSKGFSLLEMIAVMGLLLLLLAIAVGVSLDAGRGTAFRGAVRTLKCGLGQARQAAVSGNAQVSFVYGNTGAVDRISSNGYFVISSSTNTAGLWDGNVNHLPAGVCFTDGRRLTLSFRADGSCGGSDADWPGGSRDLVLWEAARKEGGLTATVRVMRATGTADVVE